MNPWLVIGLLWLVFGRKRDAPESSEEMTVRTGIVALDSAPGHYMRADAATAFDAVARMTSIPRVTSSFRSREQQEKLYALYLAGKGNLAAKPGTSKHEVGLAVDARGTPEWERAMQSAGFRRTVTSEAWHWEFQP